MKKLIIAVLMLGLASCGSKSDSEAKKAELASLKTELNTIQNRIEALEKELENAQDAKSIQSYKSLVTIKELKPESFNHFIEINGNVEAVNAAFISPEMSGQIKNIYVKEGEYVNEGKLLAKLNTSMIEKSMDEINTGLKLATTIFTKQKNLWDQNIGSEIDYLTAKNTKEALEDKLETIKAQLDLAFIKAPFDGIIDNVIQKEGELATPGMQMMELVSLAKLNINADMAESYLPSVHKGDKVELSFPSFPELDMVVPIHRIGNIINPNNRTVSIQLQINNKNGMLKPNGLALIRINDFSSDATLVVPSIIIKQDIKGSFLYVAEQANSLLISKKRYVKTGASFMDQTMIVEGLSVGEKVIIEGYNLISDGSEIKIN
ncbi:MAG: hypothetical protein CVU00_03460 [Bacteroidetes bacterium HGW-Bacteroidetes-17]|jgi:RND family efflux transporter MFP subunit|nr:MAG: hypothetical protein CVU00_03460 [Bacteroidetes bacterium HGW-Bacteroidetes-17]